MELRQLTSFVETARSGTYAAASKRLHLAQPAVWKHVQQLEAELGVRLFERSGRRVRLTPAGAVMLHRVEQILDGTVRLHELAEDLQAGRAGTVTVGCLAPHVLGFLARALGEFHRRHPGVRIALKDIGFGDPAEADPFGEALRSGSVDLVFGPRLEGADGFAAYEVRVIGAVPSRHRWRKEPVIPVERLEGQALLATPPGYFSRRELDRACQAHRFVPSIALESGSPEVLLQLGREGLGIPIVASDAVPHERTPWPAIVDDGRLLGSEVWLSARPDRDPAADALFDLAREMAVAAGTR